jgi:hypothetical protein
MISLVLIVQKGLLNSEISNILRIWASEGAQSKGIPGGICQRILLESNFTTEFSLAAKFSFGLARISGLSGEGTPFCIGVDGLGSTGCLVVDVRGLEGIGGTFELTDPDGF